MELKIEIVYDTNAVTADSFYFGDGVDIVVSFVRDRIGSVMISLCTVLLGIALMVINFISKKGKLVLFIWISII